MENKVSRDCQSTIRDRGCNPCLEMRRPEQSMVVSGAWEELAIHNRRFGYSSRSNSGRARETRDDR